LLVNLFIKSCEQVLITYAERTKPLRKVIGGIEMSRATPCKATL